MRKIENKNDWFEFVEDCKHVKTSAVKYFGIGKTDDVCLGDWCIDGRFASRTNKAGDTELFVDGAPVHISFEDACNGAEFLDALLTNYKFPFYIVDTGANYSWL